MTKGINFFKKKAPLIIAEMSGNHNGSLKKALRLVREASKRTRKERHLMKLL